MKTLVTGASGFLGGWLAQRLVNEGHHVRAILRPASLAKPPEELQGLPIEYVPGDVTDALSLNKAARDIDVVFHLAGLIAYTPMQRAAMELVNVAGTANVIEACHNNHVGKLVHLSSVAAIGAAFKKGELLNEQSPFNLHAQNLGYFETKYRAELLIGEAVREKKMNAVMINPSTIYGPGDAKKGSRGVQLKVAKGKFPFYPPGGVGVVSVEDVVESILAAWKVGRAGGRYIVSSENLLIRDVFKMIASEAGVDAPSIALPRPAIFAIGKVGDVLERFGKKGPLNTENAWTSTLYHWFDSAKAQREFGLKYKPASYAIEQSLKWIKAQGLLKRD